MRRQGLYPFVFIFGAAGMAAAAGGHAVVALLTRIDALAGPYSTYRHEAIIPALAATGAFLCVFAAGAALGSVADALHLAPNRIALAAAFLNRLPFSAIVLYTIGVQLAALYSAETLEQVRQFGHPLGFVASLGAVPAVGLAIHASMALLFAYAGRRALRAFAESATRLVNSILPFIRRMLTGPRRESAQLLERYRRNGRSRHRAGPLALRTANRPPPFNSV